MNCPEYIKNHKKIIIIEQSDIYISTVIIILEMLIYLPMESFQFLEGLIKSNQSHHRSTHLQLRSRKD